MLKSGTSVCITVIRKNSTSTNWLLTSSFIIIKHLKTRQQIQYQYWLDTWCCVSRCCVSRFTFSWHKSLGFTKQPWCHRDTQTQKVQDEFVVNMQTLQQSMSAHLSAHPLVVLESIPFAFTLLKIKSHSDSFYQCLFIQEHCFFFQVSVYLLCILIFKISVWLSEICQSPASLLCVIKHFSKDILLLIVM